MKKSVTIIKQNQEHVTDMFKDGLKTDLICREIQRDTVGRSGASPTWVYVYNNVNGKMKFKGTALHKEYDNDYPKAAFGEKVWSIFGKELLNSSVRVPRVDIVERKKGQEEIISYRVMDNDTEDMTHIKDTLFNKFEREEMKAKKSIYSIEEILECVKMQVEDEENYKKIERDMIQVLLLDAITNNGDRHALNWALVRNEKSNEYSLAVFDHASSFTDMFENKSYFVTRDGWTASYITVGNDTRRNNLGSDGKKIVEYISQKYPEYFEEFYERLDAKLPNIIEQIRQENMNIDTYRLETKMRGKKHFLRRLKDKGEIEYE